MTIYTEDSLNRTLTSSRQLKLTSDSVERIWLMQSIGEWFNYIKNTTYDV